MFKSKWIRFLPFLPLIVLLITVNIYGDAGNRFHSPVGAMAEALLDGYPVYITSGNLDERELRYSLIKIMPDNISCIAVGGSNVIYITSGDTGDEDFINMGVTIGGLYDALAQFALMKIYGKHVNRVIIGPQNSYFNRQTFTSSDYETQHKPLKPYSDYMMKILNGDSQAVPPNSYTSMGFTEVINILFSLSYFQGNLKYITKSNMLKDSRYGIVKGDYEGQYYMPDGSRVYTKEISELTIEDVILAANKADLTTFKEHVDLESTIIFEKLIKYLLSQNTEIDIYLTPLAPALWDRLDSKDYPFFTELEDYLIRTAEKYSLRIIGSYNPYKVGVTNADFYDTRHIWRGRVSKYLDFKAKN